METMVVNHHNQDFKLYRFSDHLWISDANEVGEHLVREFSLEKAMWNLSFYTSDELESIFNVNLQIFNRKRLIGMTKFELASELRGIYSLEQLQQMGLVILPDEDLTQEEIEWGWDSTDGYSMLLVDDEDCEAIYNKLFA